MSIIRCDTCDRVVDLDFDDLPIYNEDDDTWTCGICQEKDSHEESEKMEEER